MRESLPSATAQRVAIRRAAHLLLDDPKVFDDPLALRIIGRESALALQSDPRQFETTPLSPYLRVSWPPAVDIPRTNSPWLFAAAFASMSSWEQGLTRSPTETRILKACCTCSKSTTLRRRPGSERAWRRSVSHSRVISCSRQLTLERKPSKRGCWVQGTIWTSAPSFRGSA